MVNEEVWANDTCLVSKRNVTYSPWFLNFFQICQLKYPDKGDREKHEHEDGHKKVFWFMFIRKSIFCF